MVSKYTLISSNGPPIAIWRKDGERFSRNENGLYTRDNSKRSKKFQYTLEELMNADFSLEDTNKLNLLKKTKTYLCGNMQYKCGKSWREYVEEKLFELDIKREQSPTQRLSPVDAALHARFKRQLEEIQQKRKN